MPLISESLIEAAALDWLRKAGYTVFSGPELQPASHSLRKSHREVWLPSALNSSIARLNPALPEAVLDEAARKLVKPSGATIEAKNRAFHQAAIDGITVEYRHSSGDIRGAQVKVFDFDDPANNDWIAVNQFTVEESGHRRRPEHRIVCQRITPCGH